ncbi:hypothetical protein CDAR_550621 [Caerostris darwini]|uniref:Uncharacterized protein n=1 Tax=Caerostris darwini TaxID=1538125 RepID=A0AAV4NSL7_9ARAC|nr:hypothetical protein CDAR_550621 [Caerostris darwini]
MTQHLQTSAGGGMVVNEETSLNRIHPFALNTFSAIPSESRHHHFAPPVANCTRMSNDSFHLQFHSRGETSVKRLATHAAIADDEN